MITTTDEHSARQPLVSVNILITPSSVDEDAYLNLSWGIEKIRHDNNEPIELRVCGMGGYTTYAHALYDLIKLDGNIYTVLVGGAYSAHSVIWCAGTDRIAYPNSHLGIHQGIVSSIEGGYNTALDIQLVHKRLEFMNAQMVRIYAESSNKPIEFWHNMINSTTVDGLEILDVDKIVEYGMGTRYDGMSQENEFNSMLDELKSQLENDITKNILEKMQKGVQTKSE